MLTVSRRYGPKLEPSLSPSVECPAHRHRNVTHMLRNAVQICECMDVPQPPLIVLLQRRLDPRVASLQMPLQKLRMIQWSGTVSSQECKRSEPL